MGLLNNAPETTQDHAIVRGVMTERSQIQSCPHWIKCNRPPSNRPPCKAYDVNGIQNGHTITETQRTAQTTPTDTKNTLWCVQTNKLYKANTLWHTAMCRVIWLYQSAQLFATEIARLHIILPPSGDIVLWNMCHIKQMKLHKINPLTPTVAI